MAFEMYADQVGKAKQKATQDKIEQKVSLQNNKLPKVMNPFQQQPIMNTPLGSKSLPSVAKGLSVQTSKPTPMFTPNKPIAQGFQVPEVNIESQGVNELPYIAESAFNGFAGSLHGLKNLPLNLVTGYTKKIEPHLNNLYAKIAADTSSPILKDAYENRKPVAEQRAEIAKKDVWFSGLQEDFQKKWQDVELSKEAKFMGDVAAGAGQMIPMIVSNTIAPGSGLMTMFGQVYSNSFEQAIADGADIESASFYGLITGAIETGTEMLFGGIPGMNKGVATKGLRKWMSNGVGGISSDSVMKLAKSDAGKAMIVKAIDVLGEGAEEYIAEVLGSVTQRVYKDVEGSALKDMYKTAFSKEAGYTALVGAATSGFMQLGNYSAAKGIQQLIKSDPIHSLPRVEQKQLVLDFAKNRGIEVEFTMDLPQGKNGFYDVKNNKIVVNENTARPYDFVLKHEFTHQLESNSNYTELRDKTLENSLTEESYAAEFARLKSLYENVLEIEVDEDYIKNEMFANFTGEVLFNDVDSLIRLSRKMPTTFDAIKKELNKYVNKSLGNDLGLYLAKIEQVYEAISRTDNIPNKDLVVPQTNKMSLEQTQVTLSTDLTPEQREFFKDVSPEVLDKTGNPIKVYHGSPVLGVRRFEKTFGMNWFTSNKDVANQYKEGFNIGEKEGFDSDLADELLYENIENIQEELSNIQDVEGMNEYFKKFDVSVTEQEDGSIVAFSSQGTNLFEAEDFSEFKADVYYGLFEDRLEYEGEVQEFYLNIKNPLVVDIKGKKWNDIDGTNTENIAKQAKEDGYDGVIFKNVLDPELTDVFVTFESNQSKRTDNFKPTKSEDFRFSLDDTDYQRLRPKVRGGWTIEKIQKQLKNERSSVVTVGELLKYENVDEVLENIYYHGSTTSRESLRAGSVLVEKAARWGREPNFDNFGGGYGEAYHSISLSKSKNVASNFTSQSSSGAVTTVLLRKGANVIEMPNIQDSVELEEMLPKLWADKVDAVKVGDWDNEVSEQELAVLNPNSIAVFREGNHYFQVYQKPRFENLSKNDIIDLIEKRKEKSISSLENKIEKLKSDKKSYLYPTAEKKQLAIERATESIERIKKDVNAFIGNDSTRSNDFRFSIDEIDKHVYRADLYSTLAQFETEYEKYYKRYEDVNYEDNDTEFLEYVKEYEQSSETKLSEEERQSYFEEWQEGNLETYKDDYENYMDQLDLIAETDIDLKVADDILTKLPMPLEINTSFRNISTYATYDKAMFEQVVNSLEFKEVNVSPEELGDTFDLRISNENIGEFRDSITGEMRAYEGADIEVSINDYNGDKRFSIEPEINDNTVFITEQGETKRLSDLYNMTREITKREKMKKRSAFPELYGERSGSSWQTPSKNNNPLLDDFHYYEQATPAPDDVFLKDKISYIKSKIDESKAYFKENGRGGATWILDTYAEFDTVMLLDSQWVYANIIDGLRGEQTRMKSEDTRTIHDNRILNGLLDSMEENGYNPTKSIFINIDAYGDAYINEGNHRLLAALELGIPIWATVRYFDMGHTVEGKPFYPDNLVEQAKSMLHKEVIRHELGGFGKKIQSYNELKEQGFDLRFSLDEYNELVAVHNTSISSLTELLNLGGIPVPSIAIVKDDMVHESFGEVSVIMKPDVVDPKKTPVFSRDAFTTRIPKIAHEVNWKAFNEYLDLIEDRQTRMTVRNFISGVEYSDGTIRLRDVESVDKNILDLLGEEGLSLYQEYKDDIFGDKLIERPDVEEFNPRTYERNPISKTHAPYSLKNLVKYMKSGSVNGTTGGGSFGNVLALYSERFSSFEEMKNKSDKIANAEESKEHYDSLKSEYFGIITDIADTSPNRRSKNMLTSWKVLDSVESGIAEALEKNNPTKESVMKTLNKYNGLKATSEQMETLFDFLERTKELKEPYFEAKPQRAVMWNEVAKVIMPNGVASDEMIDKLTENGIEIEFYDEVRKDQKDLDPQYKFSLDSEGRELTPEVETYFKDSKVRDDQGNLLTVYHGTPYGSFTKFEGDLYFFSTKEKFAKEYAQTKSFDMALDATPTVMEVYLKSDNLFDINDTANEKKLYDALDNETEYGFGGFKYSKDELIKQLKGNKTIQPFWKKEVIEGKSFGEYLGNSSKGYNNDVFAGIEGDEVLYLKNTFIEPIRALDESQIEELLKNKEISVTFYKDDNGKTLIENEDTKLSKKPIGWYDRKSVTLNVYSKPMNAYEVSGIDTWSLYELSNVLDKIKSLGYDGIKMRESGVDNYVVFNPNQIKNVTNEVPTTNPDIRFSLDRKDKFTLEDDYSKIKPVDPKSKLPFTPLEYRDMAYLERKHKYNEPDTFEREAMDKALDNFPATHKYKGNMRRTMNEWLSVAERIGQYANELSEKELKVYAAQTWGYLLPNQRPNNWNKGSGGYVEFKIQQWTNAMFKGAEQVPTKKEPRKQKQVVEPIIQPKPEIKKSKAIEYHDKYNDTIPQGYENLTAEEKRQFELIMNVGFDISGTSYEDDLTAIMEKLEQVDVVPVETDNVQPQALNEATEQFDTYEEGTPVTEADVEGMESQFNQEFRPVVEDMDRARQQLDEPEGEVKTRKFAKTVLEADVLDPISAETTESMIANGELNYVVSGDPKAINRAYNILEVDGFDKAYGEFMGIINSNKRIEKNDITLGEVLMKRAVERGDSKTAVDIMTTLTILGTELGQAVQAFSMVNKLSPEGQLMMIQKTIARLERKNLDTKGAKVGLEMNKELADQFLKADTQEQRDEIIGDIKFDLAQQLPVSVMDKLNAWRYLSMLGNPRTHFRNILGNTFFMPMKTMKDVIGLGLETIFVPDVENKSKAIVSKFNSKDKVLMDFARADYTNIQEAIESGAKYGTGTEIEMQRVIFKTKWLEAARNFNFAALEVEDQFALRRHYVTTFAQYVKAKQWDINNLSDGQLDSTREYAINEAKRMTFRDASKAASLLNHIERSSKSGAIVKAAVVPFTKTPINIIKRGVEYSPVGLMNNLTVDLYKLKQGKITPTEFIENISRGLTGLSVSVLGAFLVNMGILNIDDEDESQREKVYNNMFGMQRYTINVFGGSYSIDWLVPLTIPLIMGAEIQNQLTKEHELSFLDVSMDVASDILEPVFELTMLDGLVRTMKSFDSSSAGFTGEMIQSMVFSYAGQFFPTLSGQVARTIDPVRRSTTPKAEGKTSAAVERFARQIRNKIPGLSMLNEPMMDLRGDEIRQVDNVLGRAFLNFVSPGYFNESVTTPQDVEMQRLFAESKDTALLPKLTPKNFTSAGEKYILSAKDRTKFSETMGKSSYDLMESLFSDKLYQNLPTEEQSKMIQDIHKYSYTVAKEEMLVSQDKTLDDKWYAKIKQASTVELSPTDYLSGSMLYQQTKEGMFSSRKQNYVEALKESGYSRKQAIYLMENVAGYVIDDKTTNQLNSLYGMFDFDFKFKFGN